MIGKRIALAITTVVLGVGLAVTPASVALAAKKCPPPKKVAKCNRAYKKAAACNKVTPKSDRPACKTALKAAQLANCHTCGSSPSAAFLDD